MLRMSPRARGQLAALLQARLPWAVLRQAVLQLMAL